MKNIPKLICLILAISTIRIVSGQILNPKQQFGSNSNSGADNFGNTETCQRLSKCQQYGPIICCPPTCSCSCSSQGGGTMGGQIGGNEQNKQNEQNEQNRQNEQNENIQKLSVSQRKCLENYPPLPIVTKEETIFNITGGERIRPGEYPYMAAIGWEKEDGGYVFQCGGFLVDKNFLVTVAHCGEQKGVPPSVVRLGGKNLDTLGTDVNIKIARIITHPKYNKSLIYNDIAVFQLESEVSNRPVCLWPMDEINFQEGTAIGYGRTVFGGPKPNKLMKVKLSIFSNEDCSRYYEHNENFENGLDRSQLCAGDQKGVTDSCQGSGAPLLLTSLEQSQIIPYVIGSTAYGPRNCDGEIPTVFTRISSYIPWIESVVWPNEF